MAYKVPYTLRPSTCMFSFKLFTFSASDYTTRIGLQEGKDVDTPFAVL